MRAPEELTDLSEPVRTLQTSMLGILTSRKLKKKNKLYNVNRYIILMFFYNSYILWLPLIFAGAPVVRILRL